MKDGKFEHFEPVLVRDCNNQKWVCSYYSFYSSDYESYPHVCINDSRFTQCIPYEGNEDLVGTTNSPEKKATDSKFKKGQLVYDSEHDEDVIVIDHNDDGTIKTVSIKTVYRECSPDVLLEIKYIK